MLVRGQEMPREYVFEERVGEEKKVWALIELRSMGSPFDSAQGKLRAAPHAAHRREELGDALVWDERRSAQRELTTIRDRASLRNTWCGG